METGAAEERLASIRRMLSVGSQEVVKHEELAPGFDDNTLEKQPALPTKVRVAWDEAVRFCLLPLRVSHVGMFEL